MKCMWNWNSTQQPVEIKLKRITPKMYIFEYPQTSTASGKEWRMSKDTFSAYQAKGAISVIEE